MKPKIVNGVLLTEHNIVRLHEVYAVSRTSFPQEVVLHIRSGCRQQIRLTKDVELLWNLLFDFFDWELDESNLN
jgi:hypothetical protein